MDTSKPLLSGKAALIVGTIGGLALTAAAFIPAPYAVPVGLAGFIACVLSGLAAKPPAVVEGKPILQGGALSTATAVLGMLTQFFDAIPHGWPQGLALGAAGLLAWLTGRALPPLASSQGGAAGALPEASGVATLEDAAKVLEKGPPAP